LRPKQLGQGGASIAEGIELRFEGPAVLPRMLHQEAEEDKSSPHAQAAISEQEQQVHVLLLK